jgi:putative intracellular protease/amidase
MKGNRILIVATSHDKVGNSDKKGGIWLKDLADPYYIFKENQAEIVLASPKGGEVPIDPESLTKDQTDNTARFINDPDAQGDLKNSRKLSDINAEDFDVLFIPGGSGPLNDLSDNEELKNIIAVFERHQRPIGAVCHGTAGLLCAEKDNGEPYVKGRQLTCYSKEEDQAAGLTDSLPYILEDRLKEKGARYERGIKSHVNVVTDGNLITGQNAASAGPVARSLMSFLERSINKAA